MTDLTDADVERMAAAQWGFLNPSVPWNELRDFERSARLTAMHCVIAALLQTHEITRRNAVPVLPYDVHVGHGVTFCAGVELSYFISAAKKWKEDSYREFASKIPANAPERLQEILGRIGDASATCKDGLQVASHETPVSDKTIPFTDAGEGIEGNVQSMHFRVVGDDLCDREGAVLGTFLSHWGACAAMLGEERYAVTFWDDRLQTVVPVGKLHRNKRSAQVYADTLENANDVRLVPERNIPADARGYFK